MPRPHRQHHVPVSNPTIHPTSPSANHSSSVLNRPKQIIEIINDSSSPPSPIPPPPNTSRLPRLPQLLNPHHTQTTHTMSSDHQRPPHHPSPDMRRNSDQRQWQEPSHVFHLRTATVYSRPYAYSSNGEPLYLQFGTHGAAEAARSLQSLPSPNPPFPPPYADHRDDYPQYPPNRPPRHYQDERFEPYDAYPPNYESYDPNREHERRASDLPPPPPRRSDEYEPVRYRHSTGGGGGGPVLGPPPAQIPERDLAHDSREHRGRDEEERMAQADKRRHRLPTARTYRDFSHVPSVSGNSEDRKQYSSDDHPTKRARLNWSDELHHKFLSAVEELGVDKAVPTSIMKLMKVDGLTRENVASHLQKYRGTIKKEKEEEERRLLLKAAAKSVLDDGERGAKMTEEEVIKAVAEREENSKAPAKKRVGKAR